MISSIGRNGKVALKVCVADGHPLLVQRANYVTKTLGGHGAVREVCDSSYSLVMNLKSIKV